jgi:hypothetical protein
MDICHSHRYVRRSVDFGAAALAAAQDKSGMTNAQVAATLGCGVSTWLRWKQSGLVPTGDLTNVVLLFGLPEPAGMEEDIPRTPWVVIEALERVARLEERLDAVQRQLDDLQGG